MFIITTQHNLQTETYISFTVNIVNTNDFILEISVTYSY